MTAERDAELKVFLSELRLVKDEFEIGELQQACDSTARGFEDVVKVLDRAQATSERYIEGTFFLRARVEGNDVGYGSICAAGPHATTLHWVRNDGPVRAGELLLLDAGVETTSLYTADVTRTLPVDGRFSPLQQKIYDAVYDAQEAGIDAVKPGAAYRDFHEAAQRVLAERLVEWGLLEGPAERVLELGLQRRWTLHGTGHMLGIDVHDCAQARTEAYVDCTLEPGMVLTVEPGLYFQTDDLTVPQEYRGIGVRIEDDILVTEQRPPQSVGRAAAPLRRGRGVDGGAARPEPVARTATTRRSGRFQQGVVTPLQDLVEGHDRAEPRPVVEVDVVDEGFDQEESASVLGLLAPQGQRPGRGAEAVTGQARSGIGHLDAAAVTVDLRGDAVARGRSGVFHGVRTGFGQRHREIEGDVGIDPGTLHGPQQQPPGQRNARSLAPQMERPPDAHAPASWLRLDIRLRIAANGSA